MMRAALPNTDFFSYVSVVDAVCPQRQCPLTVDSGVPLSWDHAHLTAEGSVYVMQRWLPMLGLKKPGFRVRRFASPRNDAPRHVSTPTIAPIRQVVIVPETIDFTPSELISSRRSGAMVPRPPIMMPRLAKLAKPHIA